MRITIEKNDENYLLYLTVIEMHDTVGYTEEYQGGNLLIDYTKDDKIRGIEIIGPIFFERLKKLNIDSNIMRFLEKFLPMELRHD